MTIIRNGRTISAIRWIDSDGIERQIVQARLGDRLLFDGTVAELVDAKAATGSGAVYPATVSAGVTINAVVAAGSGEVLDASVATGATINAPLAEGSGEIFSGEVVAAAVMDAIVATGSGEVFPIFVGTTMPADIDALAAAGSGELFTPTVEIASTVDVIVAAGSGEILDTTVSVGVTVDAIVAGGEGQVFVDESRKAALVSGPTVTTSTTRVPNAGSPPLVTAGANLDAIAAVGSGDIIVPAVSAGTTADAIAATGSGVVFPATVTTTPPPQRMNKSGTQSISASTMTKVTGWAADAGYPSTSIVNDALVVSGSGTMVLHAQVVFAGAGTTANTKGCQVKVNGNVVATFTGTASSATWGGTQPDVALANGDVITMEATHSSATASNRVVQASGTYLYFDLT